MPVERLVGNGLVGPSTVRPVSGVCARSRSRPLPPGVAAAFRVSVRRAGAVFFFAVFAALFLDLAPAPDRAFAFLRERLAATFARVLLAAAFRLPDAVFFGRRAGAFFRALALDERPFVARLLAPVVFCRFVEPFRAELTAFRFVAFLAMVPDPVSQSELMPDPYDYPTRRRLTVGL